MGWGSCGKRKVDHTFKEIKQTVSYAAEVTAFAEKGRLSEDAHALAQCRGGLSLSPTVLRR
jgi:hypothetical protein